jgi:NMD protein affecting ribosome stability and mRNA decay
MLCPNCGEIEDYSPDFELMAFICDKCGSEVADKVVKNPRKASVQRTLDEVSEDAK